MTFEDRPAGPGDEEQAPRTREKRKRRRADHAQAPAASGRVTVFWPNAAGLTKLGFGRVAAVPVLFDGHGRYLRPAARYLRERATLQWHPSRDELGGGGRDFPRPSTLRHIAYALSNFLNWCVARGVDWHGAAYDDVLRYQREQIRGLWAARKGRRLHPGTANARADEATHFLEWAAAVDLRQPFPYPRVTLRRNAVFKGRTAGVVHTRAGRAKVGHPDTAGRVLQLPTAAETAAWLDSVLRRRGHAKALIGKSILLTGVRLGEVLALTTTQIPSTEVLAALGQAGRAMAQVHLIETKGGRPRTIDVPLALASELRNWIDTRRMVAAARYRRRTGGTAGDLLFLSDARGHEGTPLRHRTVQRVFKEVGPRPAAWSPHLGRHTFACNFLLHALQKEAAVAGGPVPAMGAEWVRARGLFWLDMLRRQLGHLSVETTNLYLRWLVTAVGIADLASGWQEALGGLAGATEAAR